MKLRDKEEIIGVLKNVTQSGDSHILHLSMDHNVMLSTSALPPADLQQYIGKRVGLFRCDDRYYIRRIDQDEN